MTEVEARARLESMAAAATEPSLTSAEIDDLIALAKRADDHGFAPSDDGWTPTWDLSSAAAEGWRRKAGKTSDRFGVTLDGTGLQRQQLFAHCLSMAAHYAKQVAGSQAVTTTGQSAMTEVVNG